MGAPGKQNPQNTLDKSALMADRRVCYLTNA